MTPKGPDFCPGPSVMLRMSAAAAMAAAAFAHVARAGRPHLRAAGQADRSVRGLAVKPLHQLSRGVHTLDHLGRSGTRTGLVDSLDLLRRRLGCLLCEVG